MTLFGLGERYRPQGRGTLADAAVGLLSVSLGAFVVGALFLWLGDLGLPTSVEPASGSIALRTAGADRQVVLGYLGFGLARVYLTGLPVALALAGVAAALTGSRWGTPVAVALGAAAAGTLTVLSGCHCASGSAAFLGERAVRTVVDGFAVFVAG